MGSERLSGGAIAGKSLTYPFALFSLVKREIR